MEGLEEQTEILYFTLGRNLALESLDGFPEGIGPMDVLSIADHPVLDNIRGLAGLETISIGLPEGQLACNSNLAIVGNDALESLDGLQNLRDVRGVLGIAGNQSLNDISALRNVERVTGVNCVQLGLALSDNPSLSNCSVLAPLLGYPDANDLTSALAYGSVGVAIDIGSEGNPESFSGIGMPNGEGANSVKECIDAYAAVLPEVLIEELIAYVADLNTSNGISNALDAKLSVVERALGDANEKNDVAALNAMYAFCDNAEAQRGKKLASEDVDELLASANRVIQAVDPYAALCTE